jgi:hypothetical protein
MDEQRENERQAEAEPAGQSPVASQFTDEVRERMSSLRPQAAEGIERAAGTAHRAAGKLRGEDEWMAQVIEQGAVKLSDFADTLRQNDLQTLLGKTEQFARRQPVLFTGAAMALGFALTRAAASAARRASSKEQEYVGE